MARKVFYSFHYDNDIFRSHVVRHRWVTQGTQLISGVIDKAEFETIQRRGDTAVHNWIDEQLDGTTVTVVLIGEDTLTRPYIQYEICQSINRGNGIIGVYINDIQDARTLLTSRKGNINTIIGSRGDRQIPFCEIADGIYNYVSDDGYNNLDKWVESSAKKHNH